MKKFLLLTLTILLTLTSVFAVDLEPSATNEFQAIFNTMDFPKNARTLGMGNAGIAAGGRSDSYYLNPANLARKTLISIPYAQVTLYHPYDLLVKDEETNSSIVNDFISALQKGGTQELVGPAVSFLETIKSGRGKIAEIEAGVNLGGYGFALGVHFKDTIHTYGYGAGGLDANLYDELNINLLATLALKFDLTEHMALSVGVTSGLGILGYTDLIGAQTVSGMIGGDSGIDPMNMLMNQVPLALGWYVPLNVGVNLELPFGFSIGVVGRNLLNSLVGVRMQAYDSVNQYKDTGFFNGIFGGGAEGFTFKQDPSLDVGIGYQWDNSFFKPTVAIDFVDTIGLFKEGFTGRNFMKHFRVGAEMRLLSFLDIRGGLNQGYWTVGAGIDLWAIKIDMAYYWQEFGDTAGDYGLDAFTIRFNLGFDR